MARSDGARQRAVVLSELAGVRVVVEWERPSWQVRWVDGPTRLVLMERASALSRYGVGAPLALQDMLFARSSSGLARALAWLTLADQAGRGDAVDLVEHLVEDTGYPQDRVDEPALAAADLLNRVAGGQVVDMGRLLAAAAPPVPPRPPVRPAPALIGEVVSYRWPVGGPPAELLGPSTRTGSVLPSSGPASNSAGVCAMQHTAARDAWPRPPVPVLQRGVPGGRSPRQSPRPPVTQGILRSPLAGCGDRRQCRIHRRRARFGPRRVIPRNHPEGVPASAPGRFHQLAWPPSGRIALVTSCTGSQV